MSNIPAYAFCGGGTGGHIFPALAVANAFKKLVPESKIYYFGKQNGMEAKIVPEQGLSFYGLDVSGLSRSLSIKNIKTIWQAGRAYREARKLLKQLEVKAILGTGGFVCGPVIAAAVSLRIPGIIHESNAVPGLTNRLLGYLATKVAVSQPDTARYFNESKVVYTGFPLRAGLNKSAGQQEYDRFGLDSSRKTVLVFPGSLAARKINKAVMEMLPKLKGRSPAIQFLWMTGKADYHAVKKACDENKITASVHEFIAEVPEAFAITNLIIARAGAGTVAEISATGKPALLVPYPYATNNHQLKNAVLLQKAGMARIITDEKISSALLFTQMMKMLGNLKSLAECAGVWKNNYPKHAAKQLAKLLKDIGEH